jgi:sarcosine oxidase, subunit alpha
VGLPAPHHPFAVLLAGGMSGGSGRISPVSRPVTVTLDGEPLEAAEGEPVVCALVAAGKLALARSPKFHRPRGPSCLRAACDGCLARVDDAPNVMTCMVAAREGMAIRSQNTLGSRSVDLLRMTDWFFPDGMNHHELFAGVPGVQSLMQGFARRVAGLGKLPLGVAAPRGAVRRVADVVVVGGGPSGMAVAARLAEDGRSVEVIDDHLALGGGLRALGPTDARAWDAVAHAFERAVATRGVRVRASTTAGALFGDDLLVVGPEGAEIVSAKCLVLATGAHDGVVPFEGNDLPGVMSARAAGLLLSYGVALGEKVVVVVAPGGGPFGDAYARAAADRKAPSEVTVIHGEIVRAIGGSRVTGCVVRAAGDEEVTKEQKLAADAILVDAPRAPSYELAEQAGSPLVHAARGYVPEAPGRKIRDGVWLVGEAAGRPFSPEAFQADATSVATAQK